MQAIRRSLRLVVVLVFVLSASAADKKITFVQLSDAHLFDAGKKRDPTKPETPADKAGRVYERQVTWATWDWAFDSIKRLKNAGKPLDFLVFTGDFGLERVTTDPESNKIVDINKGTNDIKADAPKEAEECWLLKDAVAAVADKFQSLDVEKIYLVRGNNDLNDEDPADGERFDKFVAELANEINTKNKPKIINLTPVQQNKHQTVSEGDYTIVGLDSSSFKNKTAKPGSTPGCPFNPMPKAGDRDQYQIDELQHVMTLVGSNDNTLIFTHIPDLDDPGCVNRKASCSSVASWNISYQARSVWSDLVQKKNVRAIFAGHFHDNRRLVYKRPYDWPMAKGKKKEQKQASLSGNTTQEQPKKGKDEAGPDDNEIKAMVLEKTYVVPPLAPKFQTGEDEQSIGFALVTVAGTEVTWTPYWANTLPFGPAQTEHGQPRHEANCWCLIIVALVILAIILFLLGWLLALKMTKAKSEKLRNEEDKKSKKVTDELSS